MASIPDIAREELGLIPEEPFHKSPSRVQADLFEIRWKGRPALLKDYSRRPPFLRLWLTPVLTAREFRALRRIQDVTGVPELLARVGRDAFLMEKLDAYRIPRNKDKDIRPSPAYFDAVAELVSSLHDRGIAHGDLRRKNIMLNSEEKPFLIDFGTAVTAKPGFWGLPSRILFRRVAKVDCVTLARIKYEFYPDALTPQERHELEHPPYWLRFGQFFKKRIYRLKKPHHRKAFIKKIRSRVRSVFD